MPPEARLTTPLVWTCTGILAVLDVLLCLLAWRLISRKQFIRIRGQLSIVVGVFFFLVWAGAMIWAWDWFYVYIFPNWVRPLLPLIFGFAYPLLALVIAWFSLKLPGNPAVIWCMLGGVEGLLSHLYAIYGLGAASKPPIMHGTDPLAVLIFAFFEKAFYWSALLLVCWLWSVKLSHKASTSEFNSRNSGSSG